MALRGGGSASRAGSTSPPATTEAVHGMKIVRRDALPVGGDPGLATSAARPPHSARARRGETERRTCGRDSSTGALVRRHRRDRPVEGPHRRSQRHRGHDAARPRAPAAAGTSFAATSTRRHIPESRAESAATQNREPSSRGRAVRRRPGMGVRRDADRASSSTTPEPSSGRLRDLAARRDRPGQEPGGTTVDDVRASWAVPRRSPPPEATALVDRVGHAFISTGCGRGHAVFAGEVSAPLLLPRLHPGRHGVVPFLLMLELISRRGTKLSETWRTVSRQYFITGRSTPQSQTCR